MTVSMPCGHCGHPMSARWVDGKRRWHCHNCGGDHAAQTPTGEIRSVVDNTISPEAVAGVAGPTWSVNARLRRPGVENYVETITVRAPTKDGAIAVAKEMLLDWIDGEAFQITEE